MLHPPMSPFPPRNTKSPPCFLLSPLSTSINTNTSTFRVSQSDPLLVLLFHHNGKVAEKSTIFSPFCNNKGASTTPESSSSTLKLDSSYGEYELYQPRAVLRQRDIMVMLIFLGVKPHRIEAAMRDIYQRIEMVANSNTIEVIEGDNTASSTIDMRGHNDTTLGKAKLFLFPLMCRSCDNSSFCKGSDHCQTLDYMWRNVRSENAHKKEEAAIYRDNSATYCSVTLNRSTECSLHCSNINNNISVLKKYHDATIKERSLLTSLCPRGCKHPMQSAVSMELNSVFFRTILMPILKKELKAPFLPLLPRKRVVSSLIGEIDESSVENCYKALPSKLSQPLTEELVDCDHLNQRYLAAINHAKNVAPLIILCGGTSGCGKTTLAALIASRFNIRTVLSTDTVREALRNQLARVSVMSGEDPLSTFSELYHSSYEAFKTREPGEELTGSTTKCRDETIERKRVLDGYHAQANVVLEAVEKVIRQLLERRESAVIEGVHLTPAFMSTIAAEINATHYQSHGKGLPTFGNCECDCNQSASPSALCVPFFVYISKENTHKERFAVRAKAMTTLRPHKNKYVKNFLAIRIIQQGLLRDLVDMHCMYLMSVVSRSRSMNRGDTLQCEVASSAEYNGGEKREEPNTPSFHHSSSSTFFPIFTVLNTNTDRSVLRIHGHLLRVMDAMRPPHIICGFSNSEKEPSTSESLSSNTSNMIAYTRELRQKYLQAVRDLTIITQVVATKSARLGLLHPATDDEHVDKNMWEYVSNSNTIISSSRERYSELEAGERFQLNRRSQTAPPQLLSYIYGDNYAHNSSPSESGLCFRTDHRQDEDTSSLDTSLFIASELIPSQREVMSAKEALNLINSRKKPKYKRISSFNGNRSHSADNPLVVSGFDSSNNNNNNSNTNYYNLLQKKRLNRLKRKTVNELSPVDHSVKLSQEDATSHFSFISDYRHITRVDDYCSDDELPSVVGS